MRLMPAPASGRSPSLTSPSTAAPPRWPCARAGGLPRWWIGCTPITRAAPMRSRSAAPAAAVPCLPTARSRARRGGLRRPAHGGPPPLEGADPAPRWTLRRLVGWARERFGLVCCRETIRAALHRRTLSWKKAKTLLGRADPERRQAFVEQLQGVLEGAQRDRHLVVYVDEAHIHQDADLGS